MLTVGDKIALVVNSNGLSREREPEIEGLIQRLKELGLIPVCSPYFFEGQFGYSGTAEERGRQLMHFWRDPSIKAIFDLSGGDMANQVLPHLDYELIKRTPKPFFGYSDLTTILNALTSQTANETYLYQIRTLLWDQTGGQQQRFIASLFDGKSDLFAVNWQFQQGEQIQGTLIGGNIRCFLKLAGTPYLPDFKGKVLFLESNGGGVAQLTTYLAQLAQMGVFEQISGLLLGTFTELEASSDLPIGKLVERLVQKPDLPIAITDQVGHGPQSKCLIIGKRISVEK